jgi:alpha-mannosidase
VLENLLVLEDRSDQGDSYTPSIGRVITSAKLAEQELVHGGPLVGELAQEWSLAREKRKPHPPSSVRIAMRVVADSPMLELRIRGVNRARNHRLRIGIATGVAGASVLADAAFGPIERKPLGVPGDDQKMETPPPTAPLHRYVSLFSKSAGVTIHSDGLAEYEAEADGIVWVTLVRAIGQLSRSDIPERPGHAGWPEATPKAQSLGPFAARLAIQIHAGNSAATLQAIDRESDRFLNPMRGFTLRSSISRVTTAGGVELSGTALSASAIKETEDGRGIVLRCVNLSERDQTGTWTLPVAVDSAQLARLDETPLQPLDAREEDGRTVIAFTAGPRAVVTIVAVPRR